MLVDVRYNGGYVYIKGGGCDMKRINDKNIDIHIKAIEDTLIDMEKNNTPRWSFMWSRRNTIYYFFGILLYLLKKK
jgi:hypothetical protein